MSIIYRWYRYVGIHLDIEKNIAITFLSPADSRGLAIENKGADVLTGKFMRGDADIVESHVWIGLD